MKDVSIIIVNYNTLKMTTECVDSIVCKTTGLSYEILLVDNASTDGSREFFARDSRVHYICSEENLGFGRANNLALAHAEGRNVFFLNSDTVLLNNAVGILSDYLDNNSVVGACGGNLYDSQKQPIHSYKLRRYSLWSEVDNLLHCIPSRIAGKKNEQFNHTGKPLDVAYVTGADLMIPKRVIEEVGVFDPDFFMYFEEAELCNRIRKAGLKVRSVPEAEIVHYCGGSSDKTSSLRDNVTYQQSRTLFLDKVYGKSYRKLTNALHSDCARKIFFVKNR